MDLPTALSLAGVLFGQYPNFAAGIDEDDYITPVSREIRYLEARYFLLKGVPGINPKVLALLAKEIAAKYLALWDTEGYNPDFVDGLADENVLLERAIIWANYSGLKVFVDSLDGEGASAKMDSLLLELETHHSRLLREGDTI